MLLSQLSLTHEPSPLNRGQMGIQSACQGVPEEDVDFNKRQGVAKPTREAFFSPLSIMETYLSA